jgi:hypothetical protein
MTNDVSRECADRVCFHVWLRPESVTVSKAVQDACAWEYDKFCNQYGIGSELLDICFK